jgi:hypothetical protein
MEISWTNCVKNEEALQRVKEKKNIYINNKKKEGKSDLSHLIYKLPSETHC